MVWGRGLGTGQWHSRLKEKVLENQGGNTGYTGPATGRGCSPPEAGKTIQPAAKPCPSHPTPRLRGGTGIQVGYTVGPLRSSFEEDATQPQAPWLFLSFVSP